MINGEEFERRMKWISQMRNLCIGLRYSALKAFQEKKIPFPPHIDIRSDYEYWKKKAEEKGIEPSSNITENRKNSKL